MKSPRIEMNRPRLLAALIALGGVTPAWAAAMRLPFDMYFTTYDYVLGGLLVVLVAALLVSITKRVNQEATEEPVREGPDLRWWKGHHQT
jgi:hypothetical protein